MGVHVYYAQQYGDSEGFCEDEVPQNCGPWSSPWYFQDSSSIKDPENLKTTTWYDNKAKK